MQLRTKHFNLWFVLLSTVLLRASSEEATESQATPSPLAITEGIGKLLGLPLDVDVGPRTEYAPQFIKQLYQCWQNGAPEDCISQDELPLSNVDIVRSYVGAGKSWLFAYVHAITVLLQKYTRPNLQCVIIILKRNNYTVLCNQFF